MTFDRPLIDLIFPVANYTDMQKLTTTCEGKKKMATQNIFIGYWYKWKFQSYQSNQN